MRGIFAITVAVLTAACATSTKPERFFGCYSATDGSRYVNFYLQISPDGSFVARLKQHMLDYQTANGGWSLTGNELTLRTNQSNGVLKDQSSKLTWRRDGTLQLSEGVVPFSGWSPLAPSSCEP